MARTQESVTLDDYHRFVVRTLAEKMGKPVSNLIASMVEQWVADHPEVIANADATIRDFAAK